MPTAVFVTRQVIMGYVSPPIGGHGWACVRHRSARRHQLSLRALVRRLPQQCGKLALQLGLFCEAWAIGQV
jgi:hypothetical protein